MQTVTKGNADMKSTIKGNVDEYRDRLHGRLLLIKLNLVSDRGDVPGWVLVVLMTTGLVTGIWTLAAPRIDSILRNSLDSMNSIR